MNQSQKSVSPCGIQFENAFQVELHKTFCNACKNSDKKIDFNNQKIYQKNLIENDPNLKTEKVILNKEKDNKDNKEKENKGINNNNIKLENDKIEDNILNCNKCGEIFGLDQVDEYMKHYNTCKKDQIDEQNLSELYEEEIPDSINNSSNNNVNNNLNQNSDNSLSTLMELLNQRNIPNNNNNIVTVNNNRQPNSITQIRNNNVDEIVNVDGQSQNIFRLDGNNRNIYNQNRTNNNVREIIQDDGNFRTTTRIENNNGSNRRTITTVVSSNRNSNNQNSFSIPNRNTNRVQVINSMGLNQMLPLLFHNNNVNNIEDFEQMLIDEGTEKLNPEYFDYLIPEKYVESKNSDNNKCLICYEEYEPNAMIIRLPCLHVFHAEEIKKWLTMHCDCPICKTNLNKALSSYNNN